MTMSRAGSALALLPLLLLLSCQSFESRASIEKQNSNTANSAPIELTNDGLMSLVKKFAAGAEIAGGVSGAFPIPTKADCRAAKQTSRHAACGRT